MYLSQFEVTVWLLKLNLHYGAVVFLVQVARWHGSVLYKVSVKCVMPVMQHCSMCTGRVESVASLSAPTAIDNAYNTTNQQTTG